MLKRTTVLSLVFLSLLAGCGKEEPKPTPAAEPAMPEKAPMEMPAAPEAAAPAMPEEAPAMPETPPAEAPPAPESAAPAAGTDTAQGKKVYDGLCFSCHGPGIAGAPKFGDKAAWEPRIAQGMDTMYTHAITGFTGKTGVMPPKGGNVGLPDDDVKAAVDYMVSQVQ